MTTSSPAPSPAAPPAPPATPTVAQGLLSYLALEGVDTLFGVPGAAVMHVLNELKVQRDKFRYVVCRQETGAAYIADGYARVAGRLGVVMVTSGPGATNALTGTMNAQTDGTPLLAITGEVPEAYFGKAYLQEGIDAALDVDAVYRAATGDSAVVSNASNFRTLMEQALRSAQGLPGRASHLSLPDDVAATPMPAFTMPESPAQYRATPRCGDDESARRAFERLSGVERPLILLGSGARAALRGPRLQAFTAMVEKFAIPVMTSPDAKATFPETHPLSLRNYGVAFCEWAKCYMNPQLVDPAQRPGFDALLVLGSSLGGFTTNKWSALMVPRVSLVQVDLDPTVIGRGFPLDFGVVAEVGAFIDAMAKVADATPPDSGVAPRRAFIEKIHATASPWLDPAARESRGTPVHPAAVMKVLSDGLPAGSNVFVDAGNSVGWALHYLEVDPPSRVHNALAMGPMGFGVCGVIGARMAAPASTCVAVVGDGAFLMHGAELSTAAANRVGAIWVVLEDDDLGMVSQGMQQFFNDPSGEWNHYYSLGKPDLARFAQSLGAEAHKVSGVPELERAWASALAASAGGTPQVIVVRIDSKPVPPYYQPAGV